METVANIFFMTLFIILCVSSVLAAVHHYRMHDVPRCVGTSVLAIILAASSIGLIYSLLS